MSWNLPFGWLKGYKTPSRIRTGYKKIRDEDRIQDDQDGLTGAAAADTKTKTKWAMMIF